MRCRGGRRLLIGFVEGVDATDLVVEASGAQDVVVAQGSPTCWTADGGRLAPGAGLGQWGVLEGRVGGEGGYGGVGGAW